MKNENGKLMVGVLVGIIVILLMIIVGLLVYRIKINDKKLEVSEEKNNTVIEEIKEKYEENKNENNQGTTANNTNINYEEIVKETFEKYVRVRKDAFTKDLNTNKKYPENETYVLAPRFKEKIANVCVEGFFDDEIKKLNNDIYVAFVDINELTNLKILDIKQTENKIEAKVNLDSIEGGETFNSNAIFNLVKQNGNWLVQKFEIIRE